ncbi:Mini-ribonuclease 3 [Kineothrix sp. MB12-C1]|uniref:Mini-ribonuclease 3 n=1 Tax=Kineothrix sp. MB12-C1 TaxID=3070215 RepID=UPI0027D1FCD0|nr:ribonuclease III domain-containing protein [Kineothrix sp. MB12-C1]WMC93133.1 ribonuclease III domain-containing protein [Kineothrix sp. MB12-C1]
MEKSLIKKLKTEFHCKEVDIKEYSPLTLAYIGDSIYDVIVRTVVVERGNRSANNLHNMAIKYVNAGTQAAMGDALLEELTPEELAVYKRGRNAKTYTKAKNATASDYRKATGLEALLGYLYLQDEMDRLIALVQIGFRKIGVEL